MSTGAGDVDRVVESLAAPLDVARRGVLTTVARNRGIALLVGRRDARVPLLATVQVLVLLAVTVAYPVWLFVLGPVVLGVPHLASDVRYLLVRRSVARGVVVLACAASAVLVVLRALEVAHVTPAWAGRLEVLVAAVWIAAAVVAGARARRAAWPLGVLPVIALAAWHASTHVWLTRVVLAQAHNVVGVGAWLLLFRRNRRAALVPVAAIAAGALLLASGVMLPWTMRTAGLEGFGVNLWRVGAFLAPGGSATAGAAAVLVFVFLQAVHYAAWLVWIPQEELPGQGTFTFRMTGRALVRDLGVGGLAVVVAASAALTGAATSDAKAAVSTYMSLAAFHAYLEIAMLAYFASRGAHPPAPSAARPKGADANARSAARPKGADANAL
jgi:hypothetical protein